MMQLTPPKGPYRQILLQSLRNLPLIHIFSKTGQLQPELYKLNRVFPMILGPIWKCRCVHSPGSWPCTRKSRVHLVYRFQYEVCLQGGMHSLEHRFSQVTISNQPPCLDTHLVSPIDNEKYAANLNSSSEIIECAVDEVRDRQATARMSHMESIQIVYICWIICPALCKNPWLLAVPDKKLRYDGKSSAARCTWECRTRRMRIRNCRPLSGNVLLQRWVISSNSWANFSLAGSIDWEYKAFRRLKSRIRELYACNFRDSSKRATWKQKIIRTEAFWKQKIIRTGAFWKQKIIRTSSTRAFWQTIYQSIRIGWNATALRDIRHETKWRDSFSYCHDP